MKALVCTGLLSFSLFAFEVHDINCEALSDNGEKQVTISLENSNPRTEVKSDKK